MKRIILTFFFLLFITSPLVAGEQNKISRGHNQIEIEGLQTINVSPVFDIPTSQTTDFVSQDDGKIFHVGNIPILTLDDFTKARVSEHQGVIGLDAELSEAGGMRIRMFTAAHIGERLAFIVNGKLIKAPAIKAVIDGKGLEITPMKKKEARILANMINHH